MYSIWHEYGKRSPPDAAGTQVVVFSGVVGGSSSPVPSPPFTLDPAPSWPAWRSSMPNAPSAPAPSSTLLLP